MGRGWGGGGVRHHRSLLTGIHCCRQRGLLLPMSRMPLRCNQPTTMLHSRLRYSSKRRSEFDQHRRVRQYFANMNTCTHRLCKTTSRSSHYSPLLSAKSDCRWSLRQSRAATCHQTPSSTEAPLLFNAPPVPFLLALRKAIALSLYWKARLWDRLLHIKTRPLTTSRLLSAPITCFSPRLADCGPQMSNY